ncbi:Cadmium-induced protein CadI [Enhygromyxa salina]|uniref:Cadmium-induced protein CadI n=1 Tax=Enhygromyxa salina TaxID=215803 RepID=A0A2S9XBC5_9BACT|nr:ArsI/CadI family heavy metal resistance metalloenzyme [Enhygromyxa salina]PRP90146.1 Cadmium-induced protein CadI [Enhygromyxa salina]
MQHHTTAVEFPTRMRAHIALACRDIECSRAFYEQLLGLAPVKVRADYVKFEVTEPPLNLTLNHSESATPQRAPAHFGIQVKSTAEVLERRLTMERAGLSARTEEGVGCCYAIQDKVWFVDPDGNDWEIFVVTEADIPEHTRPSPDKEVGPEAEQDRGCCEPTCCS